MSELQGRVALVIGGGAGIGRASAERLATRGAAVVVADRDGAAAKRVADNLNAKGASATAFEVDGGSLPELRTLFDFVDRTHGRLNILFNNVGIGCANGFEVTEEQFQEAFDINLKSHFFATNYAVPLLRLCAPRASVIYMSSGAGLRYAGRSPLYAMTKSAMLMMTRAFARHLGPDQIRVNALCPGAVETAFSRRDLDQSTYDARRELFVRDVPLGRFGQPEDVASVVAFLASDEAVYITGVALPVDGGALA